MIEVGAPLPPAVLDAAVLDSAGVPSPLRAILPRERPTVVVFVRHFGCVGCSLNVQDLTPRLLELDALGFGAIMIGHGRPEIMATFIRERRLDTMAIRVVTDPTRAIFTAAGFHRSALRTFGPRSAAQYLQAIANGHENRWTWGDWLQMGGTVMLDEAGLVTLVAPMTTLAGFLPAVDIVDAALRYTAARALAAGGALP